MQEHDQDVVVIGELNVDLILNQLEQFPVVGKEILADNMTFTLGSSSAIFASNLKVLGSCVSFVGKLGEDMFGRFILSKLKDKKLHTDDIIFTPNIQTGITVALNYGEDRAMVTYPGAMNDLKLTDISDGALKKGRHLHVSSIFLQEGLKKDIVPLFKKARELGLTTSLDPQWDPAEKWDVPWDELLPVVDVFIPNKSEILGITGVDNLDEAMQKFTPQENVVVVKDGSNGAHLFHGNEHLHQQAFTSPSVVDSIGAGDSFNAGFIHRYISGSSLKESLEFAALTGAVNTVRAGGTGSFGSNDQFRELASSLFNYKVKK
jgi:sugar/nucleoside kinase (ribokinase family)